MLARKKRPEIGSGILGDLPEDLPLIEMHGVVKIFKSAAWEFEALKGINASFRRGEFVSVVGRSGSGKSTLVNMITGIDHPTGGEVRIGDVNVHHMNESDMSVWRGRNLGIVFQFFQLLPMLTVLENVLLPMDFCNTYEPAEREARAMELLQRVGLEDFRDSLPSELSGGQQQTAAIARSLANNPPLILADEPTGNLDSRTAESVFEIFEDLVSQGKTILMVTHDRSLAERTSRVLVIVDGELVKEPISNAFTRLPDQHLLWLSHEMDTIEFEPGQPVARTGSDEIGLCVIVRGEVVIQRNAAHSGEENGNGNSHGNSHRPSARRLGPGEYFSDLDLAVGGASISGVHASSDGPLELLSLHPEAFRGWLDGSQTLKERFIRSAQERAEWLADGVEGAA